MGKAMTLRFAWEARMFEGLPCVFTAVLDEYYMCLEGDKSALPADTDAFTVAMREFDRLRHMKEYATLDCILSLANEPAPETPRIVSEEFRAFYAWARKIACEIDAKQAEELGCRFGISATQARNITAGRQWLGPQKMPWPLPGVWLGVSVEDQKTADERIPELLCTPAAVRFVSYEPALEAVDFGRWLPIRDADGHCTRCGLELEDQRETLEPHECPPGFGQSLSWIVVGGESGSGARPFDLAWARSVVQQCKAASVPVFVKQIGSNPIMEPGPISWPCSDPKGGNMAEWPEDLRVREWPAVRT